MCMSSSKHGASHIVGTQCLLAEFTHARMNEKHELKTTVGV